MNENRSKLERKLDEVNHTMELIRTIVPSLTLIGSKYFNKAVQLI